MENITMISNEKLEEYLHELLYDYGFSRTELARILHADVDDVRNGVTELTLEQEKSLVSFYIHIGTIKYILNHQDPRMTADWFFKNIGDHDDDDVICSPYDLYMVHNFTAVKNMLKSSNYVEYILTFYPEYQKTQQEVVPVVMGDGTVRLVVKREQDI